VSGGSTPLRMTARAQFKRALLAEAHGSTAGFASLRIVPAMADDFPPCDAKPSGRSDPNGDAGVSDDACSNRPKRMRGPANRSSECWHALVLGGAHTSTVVCQRGPRRTE
jgi:hypothetical protein